MPLSGHCNCNSITITVSDQSSGDPHQTIYCHCTTCRRQSGASGTFVVIVDEGQVAFKDDGGKTRVWRDELTDSGVPLERWFCGGCGCPLITITPTMPGKMIVKMGLFDEIPPVVLEIYTKNKPSWEPSFGVGETKGAYGS